MQLNVLPENAILVIMMKVRQLVLERLDKLIHLVLSTNVFRFDNQLYEQIKGTVMGTQI